MVALNKLPYDEVNPVVRALGNAGLDEDIAESIRQRPFEAESMVSFYLLRQRWFLSSPLVQMERVRRMDVWKNAETADNLLKRAKKVYREKMPQKFIRGDLRHAPVLVPIFDELTTVAVNAMFRVYRASMLRTGFSPNMIREDGLAFCLLSDTQNEGRGCKALAWAVMDLVPEGAPEHQPDIEDSARIMSAAAMHPYWILASNGREIPYPRLPGVRDASGNCLKIICEWDRLCPTVTFEFVPKENPSMFCTPLTKELFLVE